MASHSSEQASLEQLQSAEQVALLDAIDDLRNQGLGRYNISLPQLIVCGDQSSGKSSVLEGLTRLRFPTKDTVCTTFATELVLRKGPRVEIECTISPANNRTQTQASKLQKFRRNYLSHQDFSFPALIDEARECMGIKETSTDIFSEDVLKVQYTGPDVPSLTIVDLPGLVHLGTGADRVRDLVQGYMKDPKSIILAVVSAKNDWENQIVFRHAEQIDPTLSRTLGIITKPDTLPPGFSSETTFVELAMNQKVPLTLGWHVVKNRKPEDQEDSIDKRDESEKLFFASGIWKSLPRSDLGIDSLRVKLSKCLLRHIRAELPSLTMTIQEAITTTASNLKSLGDSRETHEQQRDYLILLAERFQHHTRDALQGSYRLPFFQTSSVEGYHQKARLRTEIQNLNIAFAQAMYLKGHTWEIIDEDYISPSEFGSLSSDAVQSYVSRLAMPEEISRSTFLSEHIGRHVRESRPAGLPSYVNPWVVGTVFRDQSRRWKVIAEGHVDFVFQSVQYYIDVVVESLTDPRTGNLLKRKHIDAQLVKRKVAYKAKLEELLKPFEEGDPIMYDPTFISELGEIRARRYLKNKSLAPGDTSQSIVPSHHLLTQSLDDFTNCEILDLMQTYYKRAIAVFISNVTVLAIENCLLQDLEQVFAPSLVSRMSKDEVYSIASECEEMQEQRAHLRQKLEDLRKSKEILDFQACDTRTTKYNPTRAQESSPIPSDKEPSQPRTPTSKPEVLDFKNHSDSDSAELHVLPVTPPPTDPKSRHSKVRAESETPSKTATARGLANSSIMHEELTPPHSNAGDDDEFLEAIS